MSRRPCRSPRVTDPYCWRLKPIAALAPSPRASLNCTKLHIVRWLILAAGGQILAISQCPAYGVFSGVLLLMAAPMMFKPQHQGRRRLARLRPMIGAYLVLGASLVGIFLVQSWFIHQPDFLAGIPESRITPSFGLGIQNNYLPVARGGASNWTDTAACLRANGIRWVVVHGGWFADVAAARACAAGLSQAAGPPVANTGDELVYDLDRVATGGVDPISCIRQGSPGGEAYKPPVPAE